MNDYARRLTHALESIDLGLGEAAYQESPEIMVVDELDFLLDLMSVRGTERQV